MDAKTLHTLEYPKILEKVAAHASFSASAALARAMRPTNDLRAARERLAETSEARRLLAARPETTIGGAHDIRTQATAAARGAVLDIPTFLDIKATLISARELAHLFERLEDTYPALAQIATSLPPPLGLINAISTVISDRSEIRDDASPELARIRHDLRTTHERLLTKMQRMLSDPKITPYLQDNLITQRDGRYVIPLRAEFKGRVKAIVHDQSSSGATLFIEPLSVVETNNEYRELQLAERDEERRILAALSAQVGARAADLHIMVENIAALDLIFARAKYAEEIRATEPALQGFHGTPNPRERPHPGSELRLPQARHPLLDPETVVPIDFLLDERTYALIITGPNTGGKTVTLKTVGLLALMAQAGLHLPTGEGASLTVFRDIFADIGDEQSIEQSLSTFSGHITNIVHILQQADARSLVILDELGSGTDPQEGAALATAILKNLLARRVTTLVATHYPELKTFALSRPGLVNASVEFDIDTLRPTFHLIIGLPGRSNALAIAERLGLPAEIIAQARTGLHPDELRAESLLEDLHQQRERIHAAREEAEFTQAQAEAMYKKVQARLEAIEDERRSILEKARQEAAAQLEALEKETAELRRQLARARQPLEIIAEVTSQVAEKQEEVAEPVPRQAVEGVEGPRPARQRRALRLGDKVRLRALGAGGVVSALSQEGEVEVQIGALRVRTTVEKVTLAGEPEEPERPAYTPAPAASGHTSPGIELDLRGQRVETALEALDRYLDSAYLAELPWVRIIHGKGTGRLREAVRQALQSHPHIGSFEEGKEGEGAEGVTVAKLRNG